MDWLVDPFSASFMQRALAAGLLTAVTTSVVGTWVVIRGLSFMGDALAHGVLPGIALAFLWGFDLTLGALASAAVMVVGIGVANRRGGLTEDTSIGLLFVGMLALGVVIVSREGSYAGELTSFLFGNVLGVTTGDLGFQAVVAVVCTAAAVAAYRPFIVLSFNSDKAAVLGLRPGLAHGLMLGLVALAVVASFRSVGTLLVFGLLVAPPATASLLARRVPVMMATGAVLGSASVVAGLLISYHLGTAAGATMAGVAVAAFFVVLMLKQVAAAMTTSRASRPA